MPMHVINYSKSEQFEQDLLKFCVLGRVPSDLSDRVSEILQAVKTVATQLSCVTPKPLMGRSYKLKIF